MIRWGMIGCGDVTEVKSAPAYNIEGRSQLIGVTSRSADKARAYAARRNIAHVFDSPDSLINSSEIDAVYIATPPASHKALALKVAAAGKPCSVEKPIANSFEDARQMTQAFTKTNVPLFVAYYRRSLPRFETVKAWIEAGRIGQVRHVSWSLHCAPTPADLKRLANWRTQAGEAPGGYFDDLACHGLDLFDYYFGPISGAGGQAVNQQGLYDVPDAVTGHWVHSGGITGSGYWNFASVDTPDRVDILGEHGKISFSVFGDMPLHCETAENVESLEIDNPACIQKFYVEQMVSALEGGAAHPSTGESAARTAWVCDRILGK